MCDAVVEGYEDVADARERTVEAYEACKEIEQELGKIIDQTRSKRTDLPEGMSLESLSDAAGDLDEICRFATKKAKELTD